MKIFFIIVLIFTIVGCVSYHPSNLSSCTIQRLKTGMTQENALKITRKQPYYKKQMSAPYQNTFVEYYTHDKQSGSQFWCKSVLLFFKDSILNDIDYVTDQSAQQRCNNYAAQSQANANAFAAGANTFSNSLNNRTPSGQKTCSSDYSCDTGQKCAKKSNGYGGTEYEGICVDVYYYN